MPSAKINSKSVYLFIVIILLGITAATWYFRKGSQPVLQALRHPQSKYTTIEGTIGTRTAYTLPDSTKVLLNGASRLLVPDNYAQVRKVLLDGEAYFDATTPATRPLVVVTNILTLTTQPAASFKVRCFEAQQGATAYLGKGNLQVTKSYHSNTDNQPEILGNGNMILANKEIDLMEKETYQPAELDSWVNGELEIKDLPFMNAMHQLEEWYGIEIYVENSSRIPGNISGQFYHKSLQEVLDMIKDNIKFEYQIKRNRVNIQLK